MPGRVVRNDRGPFPGVQDKPSGPLGSASAKARSVRDFQCLTFRWRGLSGPRLSYIVSRFSGIAFSGHMLYTKAVSRPHRGLLIFCFVVPKWCPTLQNHAVTGYAGLFAGFEEMPISCGFEGCSYDTTCRLMTPNLSILAIKNSSPSYFLRRFPALPGTCAEISGRGTRSAPLGRFLLLAR